MLKIPVNMVPWSLLNKVPEVPKCLECPSFLSARLLEYPSVLNSTMPECLQSVYRVSAECPNGTKF